MPRQGALARMAEDLSCEETTTGAMDGESVGSSKSEREGSLSCEFSLFEGGSSGSEAADGATIEPYQYEPLGSHSSSGTDSSGGSADDSDRNTQESISDACTGGTEMPQSYTRLPLNMHYQNSARSQHENC